MSRAKFCDVKTVSGGLASAAENLHVGVGVGVALALCIFVPLCASAAAAVRGRARRGVRVIVRVVGIAAAHRILSVCLSV